MEATIYTKDGKAAGSLTLPESVFGATWNADLVHEVVTSMQSNARAGTAHTKGRGDVRGGGKKPWRQKGTGRARHGSTRSPIWAGGGVAHGPTSEKDYNKKVNKNVRARALAAVLSKKHADGEVILIESITFGEPKAADAKNFIKAVAQGSKHEDLATKRKNTALVVLPNRDTAAELSFRNFGNMTVVQAKDINPVDLLTYKYVLVAEPAQSVAVFEQRVATKSARAAAAK
jgi:large subunit ribosomal protein L4